MARLRLPEPLNNGLLKLAALPEDSFNEFLSTLENIPHRIKQHRVFDDETLAKLQTISQEDAKVITEAVFALHLGFNAATIPLSTYASDVTEAVKEIKQDAFEWTEESVETLKQRLIQLLSVDALKLVAKAHDILIEHYRTFYEARIVSDVRPVFGEDVAISPKAAVIVHSLKIDYMEGGESKEFFVALDTKDIEAFINVLDRAKAKTETLKAFIASANLSHIDIV
jgi:hypothetical protein